MAPLERPAPQFQDNLLPLVSSVISGKRERKLFGFIRSSIEVCALVTGE